MTNIICVDAGPVVHLVAFPDKEVVRTAWERWEDEEMRVIAPALVFYEVTNVLYRYQRHGLLSGETVTAALTAALDLPIELIEDAQLHHLAASMATRFDLPAAYDAHYLALAERFGAELWTIDERLHRRLREAGVDWIYLMSEK